MAKDNQPTLHADSADLFTVDVRTVAGGRLPQDRRMAESLGVEGFMTKPFSNTEVVQAVQRLAGR